MDKYLFLSDLDGTLLTDDEKVISPGTGKVLSDFINAGNYFAISTGRARESALMVYRQLGFTGPNVFVSCYNGGEILSPYSNETISRVTIDIPTVREIFDTAAESGIYVQTYSDSAIIAPEECDRLDYYRKTIKLPVIVSSDPASELSAPPCKMIAIELKSKDKLEQFKKLIEMTYPEKLALVYSNDYYLEIIPRESGKGKALKTLAQYLHIPMDHTIAAGDAGNDRSMIEEAGTGIAMINGSRGVIEAADIVTKRDNNHDGLMDILKQFV